MRMLLTVMGVTIALSATASSAQAHTSELWQPFTQNVQYLMHEHRDIIHGSGAYTGTNPSAANDLVYGGGGADLIKGGTGDDDLYGGYGEDEIHGGDGVDYINCGPGWDYAWGGAGADVFNDCEVTDY
jgi:Ca2+-binding RTX toxin-like protein